MSDGTAEARTAARWWAEQLAGGDDTVDVGSAESNAFASFAKSQVPRPSPEQVEAFRAALEPAILAHIHEQWKGWQRAVDEGDPLIGSALRSIGVDYGPDPVLADALSAAGLGGAAHRLLLPMKTVMWVNPGVVKVSGGYNAPETALPLEEA